MKPDSLPPAPSRAALDRPARSRGSAAGARAPLAPRLLGAHVIFAYALLYLPILVLVVFSFNKERQTATWTGFTLQWYDVLLHDHRIFDVALNSLYIGLSATAISTIIGTLAALAMARPRFIGRRLTAGLIYLPVIIPEIVVGAASLTFFGVFDWKLGMSTVILAHIGFCVSYVAIVVRARLTGFDASLEEAAMDLGAAPLGVFFRVKLPLMMPGIVAGALLAFTLSIDDYVITSFVAGSAATTLPMAIMSMIHTGVTPEINAVSTLLLIVTVVIIISAQLLIRPGGPRRGKKEIRA